MLNELQAHNAKLYGKWPTFGLTVYSWSHIEILISRTESYTASKMKMLNKSLRTEFSKDFKISVISTDRQETFGGAMQKVPPLAYNAMMITKVNRFYYYTYT